PFPFVCVCVLGSRNRKRMFIGRCLNSRRTLRVVADGCATVRLVFLRAARAGLDLVATRPCRALATVGAFGTRRGILGFCLCIGCGYPVHAASDERENDEAGEDNPPDDTIFRHHSRLRPLAQDPDDCAHNQRDAYHCCRRPYVRPEVRCCFFSVDDLSSFTSESPLSTVLEDRESTRENSDCPDAA